MKSQLNKRKMITIWNYYNLLKKKILYLRFISFQIISEPVSTGSLLLISKIGRKLKNLYVRKSTVVIDCDDWQRQICADKKIDETWLTANATSLHLVEHELSQRFSKQWQFSSENIFNSIISDALAFWNVHCFWR